MTRDLMPGEAQGRALNERRGGALDLYVLPADRERAALWFSIACMLSPIIIAIPFYVIIKLFK